MNNQIDYIPALFIAPYATFIISSPAHTNLLAIIPSHVTFYCFCKFPFSVLVIRTYSLYTNESCVVLFAPARLLTAAAAASSRNSY